jgi:hypothetical protein
MSKKMKFLGILFLILAVVAALIPSIVMADQQQTDNDIATSGMQNIVNLTATAGETVTTSGQITINWQGSRHLSPGADLEFVVIPGQTTLPAGYGVSPVTGSVPSSWGSSSPQTAVGTSTVSFTAPSAGSYSYDVKWAETHNYQDRGGDALTGAPALVINLTVTAAPPPPPPSDTTAPTTTITLSPVSPDGLNGWYISDVTITITANDPDDSVAETRYSLDPTTAPTSFDDMSDIYSAAIIVSADGEHTIYAASIDSNGNKETPVVSASFKIDKTPPVVYYLMPVGPYILHGSYTATWTASDASPPGSGLATPASGSVALDTSSVGAKTLTIPAATDLAGNTFAAQTVTYSVLYNFGGFLPPIGVPGAGLFKLGSTVPVKFQLTDANGAFVTGAVAEIQIAKINNDTGLPGDYQDGGSSGSASTGNVFRYDSTGNLYIFNLSTKGLSAGTWSILVILDDGSPHSVLISLK